MTNLLILPSTLFLTLLMAIGLVFFVRASVKDRTETRMWLLPQPETQVLETVTQYLEGRAYRLDRVDRTQDQAVFQGLVRASGPLAIFLSALVAVVALCLGLVLSAQFPQIGYGGLSLVLMAPLAGWFYHRNAQRIEQVSLSVQSQAATQQTQLRVTAHRDEIKALQTTLQFPEPIR